MAQDLLINGQAYAGVDSIKIPTVAGGEASFVEATAGLKVNSIATTGQYDTTTHHGSYWAAIDADGNLLLVVEGGTSTNYESIRFMGTSLPEGVTLVNQSYYAYASMTAGMAYVAVFSGLTKSVDITLDFYDVYASTDYVYCGVTITE
jgi:hypothetical protein